MIIQIDFLLSKIIIENKMETTVIKDEQKLVSSLWVNFIVFEVEWSQRKADITNNKLSAIKDVLYILDDYFIRNQTSENKLLYLMHNLYKYKCSLKTIFKIPSKTDTNALVHNRSVFIEDWNSLSELYSWEEYRILHPDIAEYITKRDAKKIEVKKVEKKEKGIKQTKIISDKKRESDLKKQEELRIKNRREEMKKEISNKQMNIVLNQLLERTKYIKSRNIHDITNLKIQSTKCGKYDYRWTIKTAAIPDVLKGYSKLLKKYLKLKHINEQLSDCISNLAEELDEERYRPGGSIYDECKYRFENKDYGDE